MVILYHLFHIQEAYFIYSFIKHFLGARIALGTVLGSGETKVNKMQPLASSIFSGSQIILGNGAKR